MYLVGAFLLIKVASTISGGIVDESQFSHTTGPAIVFAALGVYMAATK